MISVRDKREGAKSKREDNAQSEPERIVIIGGGAAGFAAAEMLRRQGYQGSLVMLSGDTSFLTIVRTSPKTISPAPLPLNTFR